MTRILLVRHAECWGNLNGRWAGQADLALTPTGIAQARRLSRPLREFRPEIAYASDLRRALATARIALHGLAVPIVLEPALREVHLGAWEGLTSYEIEMLYPETYARLRAFPHDVRPPGGESTAAMRGRALAALDRIALAEEGKRVAVFTHGAVLRAIAYAASEDLASWQWPVHNAGIALVEWGRGERRILSWNDTNHLVEDAAAA